MTVSVWRSMHCDHIVMIYRTQPTLSRKRKKHLMETNDYIQDVVKKKKVTVVVHYWLFTVLYTIGY